MSARPPRICVSIPALNEAASIGAAIQALRNQSYPRHLYEVVAVVDDATTDGTAEIARLSGARVVIDDRHHTIGGATALGFDAGGADVLASTHADTFVCTDWLAIIAECLAPTSPWDGVGGPLCAKPGTGIMPSVAYAFTNTVYRAFGVAMRRTFFAGPNYAYRRSLYQRAGGLDRGLRAGEDNDLSIRARHAGGRLLYDARMRVYTSERRFREGYGRTLVSYGRLFVDINRGTRPTRFNHVR